MLIQTDETHRERLCAVIDVCVTDYVV
jgi:hypothetical protein